MGHTASNLLVHVVFSTKNREKLITAAIRERLFAYLARIIDDEGGKTLVVNGGLEHVHLLLRLPPKYALADLMRRVKAGSSAWLRRGLLPNFAWQEGYAAFSVSQSQRQTVYEYIAGQEAHHRSHPFEAELVSLLKKNEIDFDERYLWS